MYKKYFFLIIFLLSYSLLLAQVKQDKVNKETTKPTIESEVKKSPDLHLASKNINSAAAATSYDFTIAGAAYKPGVAEPMIVVDNIAGQDVYAMIGGDSNSSGIVTNSDKDEIINNLNNAGYYNGDNNLSGIVTNSDKDLVINNLNKSSQVP